MPPTHFCLSARNLGWYVYRSFLPFVALINYLSAGSIHPVVIVPGLSASALENTETGERKWVNEFEILGKLLYLSPRSFSHLVLSLTSSLLSIIFRFHPIIVHLSICSSCSIVPLKIHSLFLFKFLSCLY